MLRRTPLKARKPWGSQKSDAQRERDAARKEREFARKYDSLDRVFYVSTALNCVVPDCDALGDMQNAHVETGGTGRKANADRVVPMCERHHEHHRGRLTFAEKYGLDLDVSARLTETQWQLYGADVIARAKASGAFDRWLARRNPPESTPEGAC
jgi:hypothetical protein